MKYSRLTATCYFALASVDDGIANDQSVPVIRVVQYYMLYC